MKHMGGTPLHNDKFKRPNMEDMPIANMHEKCGDCIVMKTVGECDKKCNTLGCDIKKKRFKKNLSDEIDKQYDEDNREDMEKEEKQTLKELLDNWSTVEDKEDD